MHPDFPAFSRRCVGYDRDVEGNLVINTDQAGNLMLWQELEAKKKLYAKHGITEKDGTLILSQDDLNGSIDSAKIKKLIEQSLR